MMKKATGMFISKIAHLCFSPNADAFVFIVEVFQIMYTVYLPNLVSEQNWCLFFIFNISYVI